MSASPFFRNQPKKRIADSEAAGAFIITNPDGSKDLLYEPQPKQRLYHASTIPNLIMEGRRGTGKSLCMRWDMHMRALSHPGFMYLILRRTMPELRRSHLLFINQEMERFRAIYPEARYLKGIAEAHYGNGSVGLFGHCESEADVLKYLGGQFHAINFDEITTFPFDMITKISTSGRVEAGSGVLSLLRGGTNPIGESAEEVHRYFIAKDITPEEDRDYVPSEWGSIKLNREDNIYIDFEQYDKRFAGLPEAYRKGWLEGEWGIEGAYFNIQSQHLVDTMPSIAHRGQLLPATDWPWLHVYRIVDWGFNPDPAFCLWVAVLPNGREIPFYERFWFRTPAQQVAEDIKQDSEGMHIVATFADPTLWDGEKEMGHCLADEFETRGVPLVKAKNDRTAAGFAIQEHFHQKLEDGLPRLQLLVSGKQGVPMLERSLRSMRVDKKRPGRLADHKHDHATICLGYFCMAGVGPTQIPNESTVPRWMQHKHTRRILGSEGVRRSLR